MKYVTPIVLLVGYFMLIFFKAGEIYAIEKESVMPKMEVFDLKTKHTNFEQREVMPDLVFEALKINEVEKRSFMAGPVLYGNVTDNQIAYLTFDDGPSKNTEKILDILKAYDIPGTFFVNGNESEFAKDMYMRIVDEGHAIGNHSYSHNYSSIYQSVDHFLKDFLKMEQLLIDTIGFAPKLIRYPGGSNNTVSHRHGGSNIMGEIVTEMEQRGYLHTDWNVDSLDTSKVRQSKDVIVNAVLNGAKGKNELIILFHDSQAKTTTVEALPKIIDGLIEKGYQFEKMTEETFYIQFKTSL